jgi:signal transduction histidine kinase
VFGDRDRLQQVVWNLVSNALKFTPKGGRVEVELSEENGDAGVRVSDTGIGIAADFLPFVFDRFRQADSTMSRRHSGLGLGMAIVRHLVELHGGTVSVESEGDGKTMPIRAMCWRCCCRNSAPWLKQCRRSGRRWTGWQAAALTCW